jgi:hypothetical protein
MNQNATSASAGAAIRQSQPSSTSGLLAPINVSCRPCHTMAQRDAKETRVTCQP